MGIAQEYNESVASVCTSGTAVSNYLSNITEAYYSNVPIVAITFDRGPYTLNQLETQKIDQTSILMSVCKKSVTLPIIKDEEDIWYCERLINEALIALKKGNTGPVQINIPLLGGQNELVSGGLYRQYVSNIKPIKYISIDDKVMWKI